MKHYYDLVRHDGNADLFQAIEMSVLSIVSGYPFHIHAEGLRGTGKTTIMRAASKLLPPIHRIQGCIYNCDPQQPHCPQHRDLSPAEIASIGSEVIPRPFLEISHSAKIGTIVGSIDLAKLTDRTKPTAALLPGTIPQAHRGIIFIDEINRLADTSPEIADILLDVMGTKPGRIQVEETGLPTVEMPVQVTVWAASNPDEDPGALMQVRKQLSDRFDITVSMGRPSDYHSVMAILDNRQGSVNQSDLAKLSRIMANRGNIQIDAITRKILANIYIDFGLESIRAVEAMETAALLSAVLNSRQTVAIDDLIKAAPMTLGHRVDNTTITNILKYLHSITVKNLTENIAHHPVSQKPPAESNAIAHNKSGGSQKQGEAVASWWMNFLNALRRQLQGRKRKFTSQQNNMEYNRSANQSAGGGAVQGNTTAGSRVLDPCSTKIVAPPKHAKPLTELPLEQYVNGEERLPNG